MQYKPNIRLPAVDADIKSWIFGLEVALSSEFHNSNWTIEPSTESVTAKDLAYYLMAAYKRNDQKFDLLSYLGLKLRKWHTVIRIIKRLIKEGNVSEIRIDTPTSIPFLKWEASRTLDDLTTSPFGIEQAALKLEAPSLASFADYADRLSDLGWTYYKGALGMVWRALGSMILAASRLDDESRASLMPHVLEIIALLHRHNIIPHAVYQPPRATGQLALQQPPTLHLLSNQILIAISDAEWRASKSSNAIRSKATGSQYDYFGNEMTGTAFRSHVQQLKPEVWLELVLWSCLHGGWIEEGASTLQSTLHKSNGEWSLINWTNELLQAVDTSAPRELSFSSLFKRSKTDKKRNIEKTLSSELVAAYIDALTNTVRLGVGERGMAMSRILNLIRSFKGMLDRSNFGLGTASWDSIIIRLLESEGINVDKNPSLVQEILKLSQPFAREIQLENTASVQGQGRSGMPSIFDPSAAVLGICHHLIGVHIRQGNPNGALKTFEQLQAFTDDNKKRSMAEFFKSIRSSAESNNGQLLELASIRGPDASPGFASSVSQLADTYPNFYPQLPKTLIALLLDQCTHAGALNFAKWLLYSQDADGPVIPEATLKDPIIVPSLIRYATAANDKLLLQRVIADQRAQATLAGSTKSEGEVAMAFLESQISLRRWDSVEKILKDPSESNLHPWDVGTFATLASEVLKSDRGEANGDGTSRQRAKEIFANLASNHYGAPRGGWRSARKCIDTILGYISSLSTQWFVYCAPLRPVSYSHKVVLPTVCFNKLIDGTVHTYGSLVAMQSWIQWCGPGATHLPLPKERYAKENDPGFEKIPYLSSRQYDTNNLSVYIESPTEDLAPFSLYDKVTPGVSSVSIIVRGAAAERATMSKEHLARTKEAYNDLSEWALAALRHMGLDDEEIAREIEPLKS